MNSMPKTTAVVLALSLLAAACGSTLDEVAVEQPASPEVPRQAGSPEVPGQAGSPEVPSQSGDVSVQVEEAAPEAGHDVSTVDEGLAAVTEDRLGSRFAWCGEVQAEWDALGAAVELYLSAADAWIDVETGLLYTADALDLAESEAQAALARELVEQRKGEVKVAARMVGDRFNASAWASTLSEVGGEFNVDFIEYLQSIFGDESVLVDTTDKTLEVAYDRAWRAFTAVEMLPRYVKLFYLSYFLVELGGETYRWREYADTIGSALESAENEFYVEDSFADVIRSESRRAEDVDAYLREAYDAVQSILELEPAFLKQLDELETIVRERLPSRLPEPIINEILNDLLGRASSFRVFINFISARSAVEAYENTRSQQSITEALLAQEAAFDVFEQVIFGLRQEPSAGLLERTFSDTELAGSGWRDLALLRSSGYPDIQEKWVEFQGQYRASALSRADPQDGSEAAAMIATLMSYHVPGDYLSHASLADGLVAYEAFQESMRESCRVHS